MAKDNHNKTFSALDIERYHKGLLSPKERNALEKAALDDPFLADALEGYAVGGVNVSADITDLRNRLSERTEQQKAVPLTSSRRSFSPALRIAAMLIILIGAGLLVYQFGFNKKDDNVAIVDTSKARQKSPDTIQTTHAPASTTNTEQKKSDADNLPEVDPTTVATNTVKSNKQNEDQQPVTSNKQQVYEDKSIAPAGPPVATTDTRELRDEEKRQGVKTVEARTETAKTRSVAKKDFERDMAAKEGGSAPADDRVTRGISVPDKDEQAFYRNKANTFRGRVTDATNTGIPFANVTNVQDNVGTYTDANGNFTLTSTDSVLNVQVRSLGYDNAQTQLRNDASSNKVVMQEDRRNLSEVVISNKKPNSTARANDNRKLIEPEPQDGWVKYDSYLANNLNIPDDFKQTNSNTDNSVELSFEVDKNGEPINIRIEKSLCSSCDKEAIRLVKEGPKWKRNASKKGRTTVTINF